MEQNLTFCHQKIMMINVEIMIGKKADETMNEFLNHFLLYSWVPNKRPSPLLFFSKFKYLLNKKVISKASLKIVEVTLYIMMYLANFNININAYF